MFIFWNAFTRLSNHRGYNEAGPQPLEFSEIICYLNEMLVSLESEREDYLELLMMMDQEYRKWAETEMKQRHEQARSKAASKPRAR